MPDDLVPIHGCANERRFGDVVFVHGLNGNAREYWCYEGKRENYWPAWLGEDLPEIGIWSLGYENAAFKPRKVSFLGRSGYRGFAMPLWDRAKSVLLQLEVAGLGDRPLVFVTHSMGGLLIKQLLSSANENSAQGPWQAIIENTRGVCFIATPHIGSDLAKWASYFQTFLGTNVSIEELRPHDAMLRQLNEMYLNLVTSKGNKIQTLSFYETKPLFGDTLVVAEGDANPNVPRAGLYALGEDHISICKPRSKSSAIHKKLVDFIKNDCLKLPDAPASQTGQIPPPGETTWSPSPTPVRETRKPALLVSLIGVAAVACVLVVLATRHFGPASGRADLPNPAGPPIAIEKGKEPAIELPKVRTEIASKATASTDVKKPGQLTLGAVVKGRVDPMSRTSKSHYWLYDLPAGNYKAVADMERSDRDSSNIQATLFWLNQDGGGQQLLGHFNDIDYRARHTFACRLDEPRKGIIRVESSGAMMDYDFGLFELTASVPVPFFRNAPKVTPIQLEQSVTSPLLDNTSWKTDSAYYSLTLPAGDYTWSVEMRRLDDRVSNLQGGVFALDEDGVITATLGGFNEIDSHTVKSFPMALSEEQFMILRVTGGQVKATIKVSPQRQE